METKKEDKLIDLSMNEIQLNEVVYVKDEHGKIIDIIKKNVENTTLNEGMQRVFLKD